MTAYLRLLRIEFRRSLGLWLLLPLAGIAGYTAIGTLLADVAIWIDLSAEHRNSAAFIGPLAGALGAWAAGRNRRRGIDELLETTPRPAPARETSLALGTALWPAAAYALAALALGAMMATRATWGLPDLSVLLSGLLAIVAAGALGYAAGTFIRSRFTAPLIAIALFLAQMYTSGANPGFRFLSAVDFSSYNVFYGVRPDLSLPQALWFLGLTGVGLGIVALARHRGPRTIAAVAVAASVMMAGATPLVLADSTRTAWETRDQWTSNPYEPACVEQGITVCVHPAFQQVLPEVADIAERLRAPLAGIPSAPTRAEQRPQNDVEDITFPPGTFAYDLRALTSQSNRIFSSTKEARMGLVASGMARGLVIDPAAPGNQEYLEGFAPLSDAQAVVGTWLLKQAGFLDIYRVEPQFEDAIRSYNVWFASGPEAQAGVERFDALDDGVRQEWLADNYAALRTGELTLEDLP